MKKKKKPLIPKINSFGMEDINVEDMAPDRAREIKRHFIDESGMLVDPDLAQAGGAQGNDRHWVNIHPAINIEKPENVFQKIAKQPDNLPVARKRKLLPDPEQGVMCPFCCRIISYKFMFVHLQALHEDKNPRLVMAEINREYERRVEQRSK